MTVIDIPLHHGPVSSSLPKGGLDDDAGDQRIAELTDAEIEDLCRLRLINLSPELLNPAATETSAI